MSDEAERQPRAFGDTLWREAGEPACREDAAHEPARGPRRRWAALVVAEFDSRLRARDDG